MGKEEVIREYFDFLGRMYTKYYGLPDLDINDKEWDALFDVLYNYTNLKKQTRFFYGYLHVITIEVLNQTLMNDDEFITLNDFIKKIDVLNFLGFKNEEIKTIREEIKEKASFGKILNLSDYKNRA